MAGRRAGVGVPGAGSGQAARRWTRRHKPAVAAAAALLLTALVLGGGGAWWRLQQRQAVDTAVVRTLAEARLLHSQARAASLGDGGRFREALAAARKADALAGTGGASAPLQHEAAGLVNELDQEIQAADHDRRLLATLLDVRRPREGPEFAPDDRGQTVQMAEPSADEQFAAAFRDWGLDADATPTAEAAARLKERPAPVVVEVVAALDEWASERRRAGKPAREWQRLTALTAALDDHPGSKRSELREILARGKLPLERALQEFSRNLLPGIALAPDVLGKDRVRLRDVAARTDVSAEPVLGLLTLSRALRAAGDEAIAEQLLRSAVQARPREVVLYGALGQLLTEQRPPKWAEAAECYAAREPSGRSWGAAQARAVIASGRVEDGLTLVERLAAERPDNPWMAFQFGLAL